MHQLAVPTAAAMFALLAAAVGLVLVWDGDAQRAKRAAKRKAKAEREGREYLHAQVDEAVDAVDALIDALIDALEHDRAVWHQYFDDLAGDVVSGR